VKYKLRFSKQAVQDIADALDFTLAQFGEKQRRRYQQFIRDALAAIAVDPENVHAKRRPEIHRDARTMHLARRGRHARHLFLYRVVSDQFVDIGRLLHDSMEVRRHLPPGFDAEAAHHA
jgi:toxin ParE1/3/4